MNSEDANGLMEKELPMDCKPSRTWFLSPYLFGRTPIYCSHIVLVLHIIVYLIEIILVYIAENILTNHKSIGLIFVHDVIRFIGEGSIIMITVVFFVLLLIAFIGLQFRQSLFVLPFLTMLIIAHLVYSLLIYRFLNTAAYLMQDRSENASLLECFAIVFKLLLLILLSFQSSRILLRSMIDMEDEKSVARPEMCGLSLYFNLLS